MLSNLRILVRNTVRSSLVKHVLKFFFLRARTAPSRYEASRNAYPTLNRQLCELAASSVLHICRCPSSKRGQCNRYL